MHRSFRVPLAVLSLAFASIAAAELAAPPVLKPGDSWEYRTTNSLDRSQDGTFSLAVTSIRQDDYLCEFTNTRGAKSLSLVAKSLNFLMRPDQSSPSQERKWLSWPLQVGQTWKYSYRTAGRASPIRYDMEAKVEASEEVSVPAGKFQAYRITTSGTYTREGDNRSGRVNEIVWFAPAVKQRVRHEFRQTDVNGAAFDNFTTELVKFTVN
jgi:hypothetical protein